jgi:hypothetical protein
MGGPNETPDLVKPHKRSDAVLFAEPETSRFLAAVQRIKQQHRRKVRQTRQAKQRLRVVVRKIREC